LPGTAVFVIGRSSPPQSTKLPPVTRKRKLDSTASYPDDNHSETPNIPPLEYQQQPRQKASKTSHTDTIQQQELDADLPATPQTLTSDKPMDSDDEFGSVVSSEELGDEMSSSVDFGAGGMSRLVGYEASSRH